MTNKNKLLKTIMIMRGDGKTLKEIATRFKVTHQYINYLEKKVLNLSGRGHRFNYEGDIEITCKKCRKIFSVIKSRKDTQFCSKICFNKSIIKKTPEEIRELKRIRQVNYYKTEKGNKIVKEIAKKQRIKYKLKIKARSIINSLIKIGKIKRQNCSICGKKNAQAHHDDYSKPLEVKWFCPLHHKEHHKYLSTVRHLTNNP